jgi:23S rRNA pseudouridine1911/1915/1917 synthase
VTNWYGEIPILFEDNHLLVVVKPAGVLSQADGSDAPDMLTLLKEGIRLRYGKPGNVFLGLVHRLDRPVGGVMVFARTSKGASRLSAQIRERSFAKEYLAVVHGRPRDETGTLRDRMVKDASTGDAGFATDGVSGKEAVLHYRLVEWQPEHRAGLLLVRLETGRPHQIRAQLAQAGCPVWNDSRYGASPGGPDAGIALFACRLRFAHPVSREPMRFEAIPPPVEPWSFFTETIRNGMPEEGERQP